MNLRRITEPFIAGVLIGVALVMAAFVIIGLAWHSTARLLVPALQIPYMVSGALFALGLLGLGLTVLRVQTDRLHDAQRRRALDGMVRDASELIPLVLARRQTGSTSRVKE